MIKQILITLVIAVTATLMVNAQGPTRTRELLKTFDDVRAGACSTTMPAVGVVAANTSPDALLFNRTFRGQPDPDFCHALLNPDGSQMTLGQYVTPTGRASVDCQKRLTQSVMHFSGLHPGGVYTIWIVLPDSVPGPPIGVGSLGRTGLNENTFVADDQGEGNITARTPGEDLSIFGHVGQCMLDAPLVFELVYHADNQSHGGDPGNPNSWVTNAVFIFP